MHATSEDVPPVTPARLWSVSSIGHSAPFLRYILTYFFATPPYRCWQRSEGRLLLHSFLSLDIFVAFSILRFGTSAKSVSWVGLTQCNRTWRIRRCSGMRRTCPSQLHLLSLAFVTTFIVGFRASSWMVLPVIVASILDAAPLRDISSQPRISQEFADAADWEEVLHPAPVHSRHHAAESSTFHLQ